jgi:hypothetical protein
MSNFLHNGQGATILKGIMEGGGLLEVGEVLLKKLRPGIVQLYSSVRKMICT